MTRRDYIHRPRHCDGGSLPVKVIQVRVPDDVKPGDVVELYEQADGTMAADIRIPASASQS